MAAKATQISKWLKELQAKVNEDGNISYDEILSFIKEKSANQKQMDAIFKGIHEQGIEIVYEEAGEDQDDLFSEENAEDIPEEDDSETDDEEKEWEKEEIEVSAD